MLLHISDFELRNVLYVSITMVICLKNQSYELLIKTFRVMAVHLKFVMTPKSGCFPLLEMPASGFREEMIKALGGILH